MMALGAITLIALILPGQGALTDWWRDSIAPWFETGRWLLPFLLLGGGWYARTWLVQHPGAYLAPDAVTAERLRDEVLPQLADHTPAVPLGGSQDAAVAMMAHVQF